MKEAATEGFLPANYEPPVSGGKYVKFEEGATRVRIVSHPVIGWKYWEKTGEKSIPHRLAYTAENAKKAALEASKNPKQEDRKSQHFWAMAAWNYKTGQIEVMEVTQKTIQESMRLTAQDPEWGTPVDRYDVTIVKTTTGDKTDYKVMSSPHKQNLAEIEQAKESTFVDLNALFENADPFDSTWREKLGKSAAEEVFADETTGVEE